MGAEFRYGLGRARDPQKNAKNPHISAYFQDSAASKLAKVKLRAPIGAETHAEAQAVAAKAARGKIANASEKKR